MTSERLVRKSDLEGHSRSFELPLIDRLILYHFLLVGCINDDSIWHRFRDITTFTVYVTGCHVEKSFIFEKQTVENRQRGKAQHVARPAWANVTVHFYVLTDWLCYCHLANDL